MTARPLTATRTEMYHQATRAALIGLGINFVLGIAKLLGGLQGDSQAMLSDAVNSLGDCFTAMVILFALAVAQRPPDQEHPYGHSRAEAIAASNVALLIILSALLLGWENARHFGQPAPAPAGWTLLVAAANVVIKEALYQYKMRVGRRTGSSALIANAWDHRSDALCALAVLIGLAAVRWGGPGFAWADPVAGLFVVAAIVWSGIGLFQNSASELMDGQPDASLFGELRATARQIEGVKGVEKVWIRKSGLEYFADLHLEVEPEITVAEGHRIGHEVKDLLLQRFAMLRDVLIHLEPHGGTFLYGKLNTISASPLAEA